MTLMHQYFFLFKLFLFIYLSIVLHLISFLLIISFQTRGKGQWFSWRDSIVPVTTSNLNIREIIVPTIDTVRYSYLMDICIRHQRLV